MTDQPSELTQDDIKRLCLVCDQLGEIVYCVSLILQEPKAARIVCRDPPSRESNPRRHHAAEGAADTKSRGSSGCQVGFQPWGRS
jgi:hypothetical protein